MKTIVRWASIASLVCLNMGRARRSVLDIRNDSSTAPANSRTRRMSQVGPYGARGSGLSSSVAVRRQRCLAPHHRSQAVP